jgi:predicted Zn-dependent protease
MEVFLSPGLGESLLLATCRHELGHALGIWGHSDRESDALFFSQVRHSPSISPRDINTLIKVYQQPTRIGWPILNS